MPNGHRPTPPRSYHPGLMKDYLRFIRAQPRFLAFGFVLTFFSSFGQTFFISLFGTHLQAEFDLTTTRYGQLYSIATLCSGLTIIWFGRRIDTSDLRTFTMALCLGVCFACVLMANSYHVAMLVVAFYCLRLFGQGLLSHASMTSMSRYFSARRGKAMSIASLGFPAGEAIFPTLVVWSIWSIGWRQTWVFASIVVVLVLFPLVLWLLRGHAERHEANLAETALQASDISLTTIRRQWTRAEVMRDLRFYLLIPAVIAPGFIVTGVFFHHGHLLASKHWTPEWYAACFVVFAIAQSLTSLIAGPLVDRFGARRLVQGFLVPLAFSLVVIAIVRQSYGTALFLACFGVTAGLNGPVVGAMWAELYGTKHLGAIRAMATSIMVFGTAGSPVLFGMLLDHHITFESIAWMCCAYTGVATAMVVLAMRLRAPSAIEISHTI